MLLILLLYLIFVPELVWDRTSSLEIIWALRCYYVKKKRLTLKENPYFYANLPTLLKAHGHSVKIDPTEDFQQADTFYVLTDRQKPVHIMTGNNILHSFGNLWCYKNTIIFKGLGNFFFPSVSDLLIDICGRLMGESIINASLRGTLSELYVTRFLVSTCIPRPFRTWNYHVLQPIVTEFTAWESYPWTGWEHFINSPLMDSSADFCLCINYPNSPDCPVCSKVITSLTTFANI